MPTTIIRVPSVVAIFLLLGQGECVENYLEEGVTWFVAPEFNIQNGLEVVYGILNPNENGTLPEYAATLQFLDDFSILLVMKESKRRTITQKER
jgi:hypothetical protein